MKAKAKPPAPVGLPKLTIFDDTAISLQKLTLRLEKLRRRVGRWHVRVDEDRDPIAEAAAYLDRALQALGGCNDCLAAVPAGWKPPMGGARIAAFARGESVTLRSQVRASYEGVLDTAESTILTVDTTNARGKVICVTHDGDRVVLPSAHLSRVSA